MAPDALRSSRAEASWWKGDGDGDEKGAGDTGREVEAGCCRVDMDGRVSGCAGWRL